MLFHKDMLNYNGAIPGDINPYTDSILKRINQLAGNPEFLDAMKAPYTQTDLQYPMNLLDLNTLYGMSPEQGWDTNKLVSPEFTDIVQLKNNNIDPKLDSYYDYLMGDMINANPYNKIHNNPLKDWLLSNYGVNTSDLPF